MKLKKIFFNVFCKASFIFVAPFLFMNTISSKRKLKLYRKNDDSIRIDDRYNHLYKIANKLMLLTSSKVNVLGKKNVPNKPCLYIVNHKSSLDPIVILKAFRKMEGDIDFLPPVFVAKKELRNSRKVSNSAELIDTIFLDRENLRDAIRVINEEKELLNSGTRSVVVFIEGTRIKTDELGAFKSGALEPAYSTFCSIVPVVIYGTRGVEKDNFYNYFIKHKEIVVDFLKPIKYKDYISFNKDVISEKIKNEMEKKYFKIKENKVSLNENEE